MVDLVKLPKSLERQMADFTDSSMKIGLEKKQFPEVAARHVRYISTMAGDGHILANFLIEGTGPLLKTCGIHSTVMDSIDRGKVALRYEEALMEKANLEGHDSDSDSEDES